MPTLDFAIHVPRLRIDAEVLPFGDGRLYRMPFATYDEISLGAFSEQRAKYEATAPVFLMLRVPIAEEGLGRNAEASHGIAEMKIPTQSQAMLGRLGLKPISWAHDTYATPAWTAMLLEAPQSALPPPSWSQTFCSVDGGFTMPVASGPTTGALIQGEADHEYLFLPDAAGAVLPAETIARAAELVSRVRAWDQIPELHAALMTMRMMGSPLLSSQDRLTLAVRALESLLLPDVHATLKKTFARRVSALLAIDRASADRLSEQAGDLYALRSASLHGGGGSADVRAVSGALPEQLLASAIITLGGQLSAERTIDAVRAALDKGYTDATRIATVAMPEAAPVDPAASRLSPRRPSDVFVSFSQMAASENRVCCWSPLLGLTTDGLGAAGGMVLGEKPTPVLMPLSPSEFFDLEERDIRRDYLAQYVQEGCPMSVLLTTPRHDRHEDPTTATPWLERMRDLGVVTLRLAGYDRFHDPDLFGPTIFQGKRRLRRPTVLRQTVAEELRHEATQRIGPPDQPRVGEIWSQVWRYQDRGPTAEIEHLLSLYRRSFDGKFLHPEQRAVILLSLVEAMLGRFREPRELVQLEHLVAAVSGPGEDTDWFSGSGRRFRNAVAHGQFTSERDGPSLDRLSRLASHVLRALITTWNDADEVARRRRASDLLISTASPKRRALGE